MSTGISKMDTGRKKGFYLKPNLFTDRKANTLPDDGELKPKSVFGGINMSKYVSLGKSSIGEHYTKDEWLKHGSINTSGLEVPQDDVEKIKESLNLLGVDLWEISNKGFGEPAIEKSPLILEWEARKKADREEHTKKMNALVEEYNKLPEILNRWKFGDNVEIVLKRGNGEYRPGYSSSIISWVHTEAYLFGKEYRLWISNYVTSDGKLKRKQFMKDYSDLSVLTAESILTAIPEILEARSHIIRKYNIR